MGGRMEVVCINLHTGEKMNYEDIAYLEEYE